MFVRPKVSKFSTRSYYPEAALGGEGDGGGLWVGEMGGGIILCGSNPKFLSPQ